MSNFTKKNYYDHRFLDYKCLESPKERCSLTLMRYRVVSIENISYYLLKTLINQLRIHNHIKISPISQSH